MTTFNIIDLIADPFLIGLCITLTIVNGIKEDLNISAINFCYLLFSLISEYIIASADSSFGVWSRYNLDYSSHAAFALVCIVYLIKISNKVLIWIVILLVYFLLMLFQGYHSLEDIFTTIAVVIITVFFVYRLLNGLFKKIKDKSALISKEDKWQ